MRDPGGTLDVLIVDDSAKLAEALANMISELDDVRTFRATTAQEALVRARDLRPAVVLMDIVLPDGSGIEAARRIRAEVSGVDVVLMTFHDDPAYRRRAIEAGARALIVKQRLMNELHDVFVEIRRRRAEA
jgi:DNA-binding NarL/FixJ family response regulator